MLIVRKGVFFVRNDLPLTGMIMASQFATGIDNFFVVAGMMMHINALVIESINGVLASWFKFKDILVSVLGGESKKELGFAIVAGQKVVSIEMNSIKTQVLVGIGDFQYAESIARILGG